MFCFLFFFLLQCVFHNKKKKRKNVRDTCYPPWSLHSTQKGSKSPPQKEKKKKEETNKGIFTIELLLPGFVRCDSERGSEKKRKVYKMIQSLSCLVTLIKWKKKKKE